MDRKFSFRISLDIYMSDFFWRNKTSVSYAFRFWYQSNEFPNITRKVKD